MLLENVGHRLLHGALHLLDRKTLVSSAPAPRPSPPSCPGSPQPVCLRMLCVSLKTELVGAQCALWALWGTGGSRQHQSAKRRGSEIRLGGGEAGCVFVGGCDPPPSSAEVPWYPRHLPHQVWYEEALIPMDPATQDPRALSHPSHLDLRPSGGWAPDPTAMAKLVW